MTNDSERFTFEGFIELAKAIEGTEAIIEVAKQKAADNDWELVCLAITKDKRWIMSAELDELLRYAENAWGHPSYYTGDFDPELALLWGPTADDDPVLWGEF